MSDPSGVLRSLLDRKMPRQPIAIDDEGIRVQVAFAPGVMEGNDPGFADHAARRLAREFYADLRHLDRSLDRTDAAAPRTFVSSRAVDQVKDWAAATPTGDAQPAVEQWNQPYTVELARIVAGADRDVLELGFGMGVSAAEIQRIGARSHTIIECHPDVVRHFGVWRTDYPGRDIRLLDGSWQDRLPACGKFHGILFDAYPLDEREWDSNYVNKTNFAEQFFAAAARHLHPDGVFTYFSNEIDSLGRSHQRALFEHFGAIETSLVEGLSPPDRGNAWQTERFLLVAARKPRAKDAE